MDYININKKLWDKRTAIHYKSKFYNVTSFLKGKDSLNAIELALLGDIKGKDILHLQCHFGMDSISLARHGAQVTGVDFSEKAIEKANYLNKQLNTHVTFIQSDIYQLSNILEDKFDIIFTSYGVLGWLPDMNKWAHVIQHFLKPKGTLVLVEFHPIIWMYSNDFNKIAYNYMNDGPIVEDLEGTYTDADKHIQEKSVSWNHGLSEVINPLIKSGMQILDFQEYNYSPYDCFENTLKIAEQKFQIKNLENRFPMVYSIKAQKNRY